MAFFAEILCKWWCTRLACQFHAVGSLALACRYILQMIRVLQMSCWSWSSFSAHEIGQFSLVKLRCQIIDKLEPDSYFLITFTCLWTNSADDKLTFFSYVSVDIGFDLSCKLSPLETICMNGQSLFSVKNKINVSKWHLLNVLPSISIALILKMYLVNRRQTESYHMKRRHKVHVVEQTECVARPAISMQFDR